MEADGGELQLPSQRPAIERLDVGQLMLEAVLARVDFVAGQGVEHEGVVGVGAVADADQLPGYVHGLSSSESGANRDIRSSLPRRGGRGKKHDGDTEEDEGMTG